MPGHAFPDIVPVLGDGRVTLRALREDDLVAVVEQSNDPETVRWTTVPQPYGADDARDFLALHARAWSDERGDRLWAIEAETVPGAAPRFSGLVDLRQGRTPAMAWSCGFALHPAARGCGVVSAALRLAARWSFEQGAPRVYWEAAVGNWASRRVAWACGFTVHATLPSSVPVRDGVADGWIGSVGPHDDLTRPARPWLVAPTLTGAGLRLREWRTSDLEAVEEREHPEHWTPSSTLRPANADEWLTRTWEGAAEGTSVTWCVADEASDRALGYVAVFRRDGATLGAGDDAELGYTVFPSARGRGVAAAATRLVVDHVTSPRERGGLGLRRLTAMTSADNAGSNAVLRGLGFGVCGHEHAADALPDGSWADCLRWERLSR